jgi:hypothetical protein
MVPCWFHPVNNLKSNTDWPEPGWNGRHLPLVILNAAKDLAHRAPRFFAIAQNDKHQRITLPLDESLLVYQGKEVVL